MNVTLIDQELGTTANSMMRTFWSEEEQCLATDDDALFRIQLSVSVQGINHVPVISAVELEPQEQQQQLQVKDIPQGFQTQQLELTTI